MTSFFQQDKLEVLYSKETLRARTAELGKLITSHYAPYIAKGEKLVAIGILKGSFVFLADLAREIDLPLDIEFMGVSSYGDATESSGVDTGLTMRYLLDNLQTRRPASLKLASLLEKPDKNKAKITVDYLGFSIPDRFVVGYGLDAAGIYRNLPFVGVVKG